MLCHDPRISNIRWDKRETENGALILADACSLQGADIDWEVVANAADHCDWPLDENEQSLLWIWGPRA